MKVTADDVRKFGGDPRVLQTERDWLVEAGRVLYGDRWQRSFSQASGISTAALNRVVKGHDELGDEMRARIAIHLRAALTERLRDNAYAEAVLNPAIDKVF